MTDDILKEGDLRWYMTPGQAIIKVRVVNAVNVTQVVVSNLSGLVMSVVAPCELFTTVSDCKGAAIKMVEERQASIIREIALMEKDILWKKRTIKEMQGTISRIRKTKVKK